MQNRAASKAATRCGLETTTATDVSLNPSRPVRCRSATRARSVQRRRAPATMPRITRVGLGCVGLVGQRGHAVATFGVVADDAEEHHDGARVRHRGPRGRGVDRERVVSERDPVGAGRRRSNGHGRHCREDRTAIPGARGADDGEEAVGTLPEMPGPERDDEAHRPPPHPLDRPWIHPSELGAARSATARPAARGPSGGRSWRRDAALAVTAGAIGALADRARSWPRSAPSTPSPVRPPVPPRSPSRPTPPPWPVASRPGSRPWPRTWASPKAGARAWWSARTTCSPPAASWRPRQTAVRSPCRSPPVIATPRRFAPRTR